MRSNNSTALIFLHHSIANHYTGDTRSADLVPAYLPIEAISYTQHMSSLQTIQGNCLLSVLLTLTG